jgi:hypothetical protein
MILANLYFGHILVLADKTQIDSTCRHCQDPILYKLEFLEITQYTECTTSCRFGVSHKLCKTVRLAGQGGAFEAAQSIGA